MKIMSIAVCRWNHDTDDAIILDAAFNLTEYNFFQRGRCVLPLSAVEGGDGRAQGPSVRTRPHPSRPPLRPNAVSRSS
jgi:hypothetical protein